jgi:tetratricopeptide (TPR) repeat protein
VNLGKSYSSLYYLREADSCFKESLKIKIQIGDTLENLANLFVNQGMLMINLGDIITSQKKFLDAYNIQKRVFGEDNIQTALTLQNIANNYSELRNHKKAIYFLEITNEIIRKSLGELDPKFAVNLTALGNAYSRIGDLQSAKINYLEAISIIEQSIGLKNQSAADIYYNLGNIYFSERNFEQSKKYYFNSLEIIKEVEPENKDLVSIYMQLATVNSYLNETSLSEKYISEGLEYLKNNISTNYSWLSQNERTLFTKRYLKYFDKLNALTSIFRLPSLTYKTNLYHSALISKSLLLETSRDLNINLPK